MSDSSSNPPSLPRYQRSTQVAGVVAALVGVLVLLGWLLDVGPLKSVMPGWVSVKPNTALSFILIGLALLFSRSNSKILTRASRVCAALAGVMGLLALSEYAFNWNLRIDQWLFSEPAGTVGTSNPGRMAPEAAFCFVLLAVAELIATGSRKTYWGSLVSAIVGLLVTTLAFASILCYLSPILGAFGWWGLTIMAVPTAATFAVLGLAVILTTWQWDVSLWSLSKNSTIMFAIGLALLVIIGLNISRSQFQLRETGSRVARSERISGGVIRIVADVAHAQNQARGLIITGDERFLQSFSSASADCRAEMEAQRRLVADDPSQLQQLGRLQAHVNVALQWFQQVIDAARSGVPEARRREMVQHGEDLMDALRATFQSIETENQQSLQRAKSESERVASLAYSITSIGTLTTLVIFMAVLFGFNHAEAERKQTEEALRASEEQFRTMANSIPQLAWMAHADGFIFWYNQRWHNYTGKTPAEMEGWGWQSVHDPAMLPKVLEKWRAAIMTGQVFEMEFPLRGADGTFRTFLTRVHPLKNSHGEVVQWFGTNTDVDELGRTKEALRSKNDELTAMTQQLWQASKLATMGELSASVAHELNNPLATIALRAETLLMQMPEDPAKRKPLEIISQEVDRMASLVNNLLQFSRRSHRQVSTVDPREEITNSVEFVHYHFRNRKIEVVSEFSDPLPTIQADRQQLRQLFLNLLTNASDAMPQGGKLTLRATATRLGDAQAVAIEVEDTGEGITAENLEKIWDPFFTTKPEGKGTGLGLAICRRMVDEHGGTIEIKSQVGHGTTVRIVLPATNKAVSHL